jgi:hypothetical protein
MAQLQSNSIDADSEAKFSDARAPGTLLPHLFVHNRDTNHFTIISTTT